MSKKPPPKQFIKTPINGTKFTLLVSSAKGGVGKSLVAMILGMNFASRGLRTLICEVDEREHVSAAFQQKASQGECITLHEQLPQLYAVNIQFQSALREYAFMKLKFKTLYQLLLDNPLMKALINLVPGVQDLVSLGKAFHHERQQNHHGQPLWDRIIVDAPATGHGLTFLSLPKIIQNTVKGGNLRKEADAMWDLLSHTDRCAIHLVSLAEEMSVQESLDLYRSLQDDLQLAVQHIWINRFPQPVFQHSTSQQWHDFCQQHSTDLWQTYDHLITEEQAKYQYAQKRIDPLYALNLPMSTITQLPQDTQQQISLILQALLPSSPLDHSNTDIDSLHLSSISSPHNTDIS